MLDAVVVGAGAAGLAAAVTLAESGRRTHVVEARERTGGRILTLHDPAAPVPVELGAEFVHGERVATWDCIDDDAMPVEIPEEHGFLRAGAAYPAPRFFRRIERALEKLTEDGPDRSVEEHLGSIAVDDPGAAELTRRYVEGFHAARLDRMGTGALAQAEGARADTGERQFRLRAGYTSVVATLERRLAAAGGTIVLGCAVRTVRWRHEGVTLETVSAGGTETLEAARVVVTVPLALLKGRADAPGAIAFDPPVPGLFEALARLEVGAAARVVLLFEHDWWSGRIEETRVDGRVVRPNFLHGDDDTLRVWWTAAPLDAPILTGWAGGPAAERFTGMDHDAVATRAIDALAAMFGEPRSRLEASLRRIWHHDWFTDPFARGGYAYGGIGAADAQRRLAEPVGGVLYFAGEALADGNIGTVHGAIESGRAAARRILDAR